MHAYRTNLQKGRKEEEEEEETEGKIMLDVLSTLCLMETGLISRSIDRSVSLGIE
jgi:hypothetical protein